MALSRSGCYSAGHLSSKRQSVGLLFVPRAVGVVLLLMVPALTTCITPSGEARTCASEITTASSLVDKVKEQNGKSKVVVYSKTYCPYCARVRGLFKELNVDAKFFELDEMADGQDVQDALYDLSGSRTVPQVFVEGTYIGGADDTHSKYRSGELKKIFSDAGVSANL
ncbi:hypothetical protein WJX75_005590 [Coccomyxa subellipsoidea]|uniref:Glutaredoxin domain-containing protein n=1 Tax=Coccomyxa subellipsoidea TaxID=248742 RepID=A0ABR2YQV4_9CHLO